MNEFVTYGLNEVHNVDALTLLQGLPDESVNCIVTSPPYYGLRDYGVDGQLGLEATPEAFVEALVQVFREARRVLRSDGTLWLNLGDSYNGSGKGWTGHNGIGNQELRQNFRAKMTNVESLKPKDLLMIPARVALALQADGWYLRSDIIWAKPNPMPESVKDRPTKSHEHVFLLTKSPRYFYDAEAIKEPVAEATLPRLLRGVSDHHKTVNGAPGQTPHSMNQPRLNVKEQDALGKCTYTEFNDRSFGKEQPLTRNKRDVWTISTKSFKGAHFAVMPEALVQPCILAGCPEGGVVLDPFMGSGTVARVAYKLGRQYIGSEINRAYVEMARTSLDKLAH